MFLPVTLYSPLALLVVVPCLIYFNGHIQTFAWIISLGQVVLGMGLFYWLQGGFKLCWQLVPESWLKDRSFSWRNLLVFVLASLVGVPAVIAYLVLCTSLAVNHFSDGFVKLRPAGLTVQVRKYVRDDGKTIQLFPMAHVGDAGFYRALSESFQTDSTILMEGVTDNRNLLTNKITYKRMAASLGLSEQQKEFTPSRGQMVRADVDIGQFTTNTIDFLNLVMLIQSKGLNDENMLKLTPVRSYIKKLLGNGKVAGFLTANHPEILAEFETIAAAESL